MKIENCVKNKNDNKSSYKMPQIEYISMASGTALAEAMQQIDEFRNTLKKEEYFNKTFWEEALKQKHFMPLFAEFLYDQGENYEKLKQFLKDNFYEEIEKKVKEEINRDLEILSSENPEINKTSLIYTRYYTFYDFFEGDEKEIMDNLGLSKFYEDGIFDNLTKNDLDELNLFLLASLVNYDFNGGFYSNDCKRTIGCILNLGDFYEEEKADEIFANEILYKMIQDLGTFYYILGDEDWCWDFNKYTNIGKVKEFFEDEQNRYDAIQTFYDWRGNLPWSIVESCDDLENIWDEDELEGIAEDLGYESFEEMCEENL